MVPDNCKIYTEYDPILFANTEIFAKLSETYLYNRMI